MDPYWETLQIKICRKCIDGDGRGNCLLPAGERCSIKEFFPEIVTTIANVQPDAPFETYVNVLRRNVCVLCDWQAEDGTCLRRNRLECALDSYYPLVIDLIENVRSNLHATVS